jgi:hypothetical protein
MNELIGHWSQIRHDLTGDFTAIFCALDELFENTHISANDKKQILEIIYLKHENIKNVLDKINKNEIYTGTV